MSPVNVPDEHKCENPQQNTSQLKLKGSYTMIKWNSFQKFKDGSASTSQ